MWLRHTKYPPKSWTFFLKLDEHRQRVEIFVIHSHFRNKYKFPLRSSFFSLFYHRRSCLAYVLRKKKKKICAYSSSSSAVVRSVILHSLLVLVALFEKKKKISSSWLKVRNGNHEKEEIEKEVGVLHSTWANYYRWLHSAPASAMPRQKRQAGV